MGELEPQQSPPDSKLSKAEEFFQNKLVVLEVSKEEFLEMMRNQNPKDSDEDILQIKGVGIEQQDGQLVILIRTDIFPPEYMPYVETHEKWEAYIARKPGYNLFKKSVKDYKEDRDLENLVGDDLEEFYREIGEYNYDFRHEFAVYKEYKQALSDGKLEEYHNWMMALREEEKPTANEHNLRLIGNDTLIRESVFNKLTKGTKHQFIRKS
ncbi:MAG TPA: hypothetical protein VE973_02180 [Candidatus Limnocylindria bacterium]|nr:hypothetical protein [Candidatus Limnocylindria bacterium]